MSLYQSNLDLTEAAAMIRDAAGSITVLTHAKPDGDAFGSTLALTAAARLIGKTAHALLVPPILPGLRTLDGQDLFREFPSGSGRDATGGDGGLFVIVDTGAWSQLGPAAEMVRPHLDRTLIIDHHLSGDVEAAYRVIDPTAAAACEIVADLVDLLLPSGGMAAGSDITDPDLDHRLLGVIHQSLFVGIASDTGWFRFSNASPRTHRLAARLIEHGVNHADLYARLEQSERPEKLHLLMRAVGSMKLLAGGRAATMTLRRADFEETGARDEETERLIDIPQQVGSIQAICLIVEHPVDAGVGIRLSFRSKPGPGAINVASLAGRFGGGGHARAAGARVSEPLDAVAARVEAALVSALAGD